MSHIEIPDGVLPFSWWFSGYLITLLALTLIQMRYKREQIRLKIPLLGVVASLMLVGMSLPLGFIPFHVNLATFAGILLGPGLGFTAAFASVFFLSLIGHGGVTMVGINSLTVGIEAIFGGYLSILFIRVFKNHFRMAIVLTTVISLVLSIGFLVAVVMISTTFSIAEIFRLQTELELSPGALSRFAFIVSLIAIVGITIETLITTWIIGFVRSVRPEILER